MEKNKAYQALEQIGWGSYNVKVLFQCGLVIFTKAWSTYDLWLISMGYILQGCRKEWDLSTFEAGIIGSFFQSGLLVGGIINGILSDKYGRITIFKSSVLICAFSSLCLDLSPTYEIVALCLFTLGIGTSGELTLGGTVFLEFCPPSKRYLLTLMNMFFSAGSVSIALIAFGVTYTNTTPFNDWRIIVGFGVVYEFSISFFRFFMMETPVSM